MAKQLKQEDLMARRKKELAILKAQNELLESAKENVIEHYQGSPEKIKEYSEQIEYAQKENIEKGMAIYGAKKSEIESATYGSADAAGIAEYQEHLKKRGITDESTLYEKDITKSTNEVTLEYGSTTKGDEDEDFYFDNSKEKNEKFKFESVEMPNFDIPNESIEEKFIYSPNVGTPEVDNKKDEWNMPDNGSFDLLPLPSNGECYKHKKNMIAVSMLNASDENAITSANLYRNNRVLDVILKRKVIEKNIDPDDLISGDRDMILLWLRATGYGVDFPIDVRDPKTGEIIRTKIDLSKIKTKEFKLKGDEMGWFDYKTGNNDNIKFKFLTHREEVELYKSMTKSLNSYRLAKLTDLYNDLVEEYDSIEDMTDKNKDAIKKSINVIEQWKDSIVVDEVDELAIDTSLTELMIAKTMSVNGNTNRMEIRDYILNMRAGEARKYRLYMDQNTPGMDFEITVNRPESLGGGSFQTFLSLDSLIFLTVA